MELTQEYFDKGIANLLEAVKETIDEKIKEAVAPLATKEELHTGLQSQTVELKQYTNQAFEAQQVWMENRFDELIVKYDVRERVTKLEKQFKEFKLGKQAHA